MITPHRECPNFGRCSVNNCPLHPDYPDLTESKHDPETICKAQKSTRRKIAEQFPGSLALAGLTVKEHAREVKRANRTPEQLQKAAEWGKMMAKYRHLSKSDLKGIS